VNLDSTTLIDLAKTEERPEIVAWIEAKVEAASAERKALLIAPIDTPGGQIIPGLRYDITMKGRTFRNVVVHRRLNRYGALAELVWASGAHKNVYNANLITKVERLG